MNIKKSLFDFVIFFFFFFEKKCSIQIKFLVIVFFIIL